MLNAGEPQDAPAGWRRESRDRGPFSVRRKDAGMTVWIVEILNQKTSHFEPTTGASLTRADARADIKLWREDNPDDKFRLVAYVPTGRPQE